VERTSKASQGGKRGGVKISNSLEQEGEERLCCRGKHLKKYDTLVKSNWWGLRGKLRTETSTGGRGAYVQGKYACPAERERTREGIEKNRARSLGREDELENSRE